MEILFVFPLYFEEESFNSWNTTCNAQGGGGLLLPTYPPGQLHGGKNRPPPKCPPPPPRRAALYTTSCSPARFSKVYYTTLCFPARFSKVYYTTLCFPATFPKVYYTTFLRSIHEIHSVSICIPFVFEKWLMNIMKPPLYFFYIWRRKSWNIMRLLCIPCLLYSFRTMHFHFPLCIFP